MGRGGSATARAHDAVHIAVANADHEVAAVVARQGRAQCALRAEPTRQGALEAVEENRLHRLEIRARLERGLDVETEPLKISGIDLGEADAVVPALRAQHAGRRKGFGAIARLTLEGACDDADRVRVEGAFGGDDGAGRSRIDQRCTHGRDRHEGGEVHHQQPSHGLAGCG